MDSPEPNAALDALLTPKGKARPSARLDDNAAEGEGEAASLFAELPLVERPRSDIAAGPRCGSGRDEEATSDLLNLASPESEGAAETAHPATPDADGGSLLQVDFRRWHLPERALEVALDPASAGVAVGRASRDAPDERARPGAEQGATDAAAAIESDGSDEPARLVERLETAASIEPSSTLETAESDRIGEPAKATEPESGRKAVEAVAATTVSEQTGTGNAGVGDTGTKSAGTESGAAEPFLRAEPRPQLSPKAPTRHPWNKAGWAAAAAVVLFGWLWMTASDGPEPTTASGTQQAQAPETTGGEALQSNASGEPEVAAAGEATPAAATTADSGAGDNAASEKSTVTVATENVPRSDDAEAALPRMLSTPMQDPSTLSVAPETLAEPGQAAAETAGADKRPADTSGMPAGVSAQDSAVAGAPDAASQRPAPDESVEPQKPAFDIVRIEANGEALIAGTAQPGSELIVLDNGEPIGRVKTDAAGGWLLIPDQPLAQGDHEFGLLLNAPQGSVSVRFEGTVSRPAPSAPVKAGDKSSEALPVSPGRKPQPPGVGVDDLAKTPRAKPDQTVIARGGPGESPPIPIRNPVRIESAALADGTEAQLAAFVIQLSSAPNAVGVAQEWTKLQRLFPDTLRNMELKLHKVDDPDQGTLYRVRTGPFAQKADAVAYCSRFRAKQQDCLVVER